MTVLIIGGSGFLGTELIRQATLAGHETAATFASRPGRAPGVAWHPLDVRDPARVVRVLADVAPSVVVNASSGLSDWSVTADGAIRVALAAAEQGCRLVHVSSDAVFSGAQGCYDESCLPDPVTPYGAAKAAAETAVRLLAPGAAVARTSLIIGRGQSVHERMVHALAAGTRDGALFTDDIRCPVHVEDLAAALWEIALSDAAGVFHLAGPDAVSRHELGVLIARRDGLDGARLPAGRRADSSLPGALDVRLDSCATQERLQTRLRGAREFLGGDGRVEVEIAAADQGGHGYGGNGSRSARPGCPGRALSPAQPRYR
ncbi:SDR family oxidoreductase [Streptomyces sp. NPDC003758]|uniref:Sugar nucleotide-binding protein n=1 Tax=Streptomyces cynarae TaxID=2981134 RepID=A0ABY6DV37_9ACTN|nr:sugar nucleotide-binding protein [Streptomyces cynarae]UXY17882.1 sugar nucleotide-binding protein [Streptomyces cynarae]